MFDGTHFGADPYNEEQKACFHKDLEIAYKQCVQAHLEKVGEREIFITAGAPGAGKTTAFEQFLQRQFGSVEGISYLDPDAVFLKHRMKNSYEKDLQEQEAELKKSDLSEEEQLEKLKKMRESAYTTWRAASNAMTHYLLANCIKEGLPIAYGTTSAPEPTAIFYKHCKDQGYKITVIHVTAADDVRWGSIQERDKTFVQTTQEDVREKGKQIVERINDTFLKFADKILFFHRAGVKEDAVLAATWEKADLEKDAKSLLTIQDESAYQMLKETYNGVCESLKKEGSEDLMLQNSIEKYLLEAQLRA